MERTLLLWGMELKRTLKLLPAMLLEAVLILCVLGAVTFGVTRMLYRDSPAVQITIAVIDEEENPLTDIAMQYIQSMESISATCRFLTVSKDEGFSMLQERKAAAVLVLPDGMVEGIMNGSNAPVQVYFPENAGIESALLKELTEAGIRMLRVAQAEIYGIYDTAKQYDAIEQLSVLEADIDRFNLAFALERLALFQTQEISATGNLSILQYGIASGIIFFLLLLGMACYPMMHSYPTALRNQLQRQGIGIGRQCFGKWLCGFCAMGIGFAVFFYVLKRILTALGHRIWLPAIGIRHSLTCLVILLCITSFVHMIFQMAGSGTSAILLLFFLSTVMIYASGGFLPYAFLSDVLQRLGRYLPTTYLIEAAGSLYGNRIPGTALGILACFTALFGVIAYGIGRIQKEAGA